MVCGTSLWHLSLSAKCIYRLESLKFTVQQQEWIDNPDHVDELLYFLETPKLPDSLNLRSQVEAELPRISPVYWPRLARALMDPIRWGVHRPYAVFRGVLDVSTKFFGVPVVHHNGERWQFSWMGVSRPRVLEDSILAWLANDHYAAAHFQSALEGLADSHPMSRIRQHARLILQSVAKEPSLDRQIAFEIELAVAEQTRLAHQLRMEQQKRLEEIQRERERYVTAWPPPF